MTTDPTDALGPLLGPPVASVRGPELLRWAFGVVAAATLLLAVCAPLFEPGRLHVQDMYVDQLGYITTARILVDTGELKSGVLMPSQIENPRFRPYMPGHFLALAGSYAVLGYGVFATLLPSLASYVLVALGLFLIGNRLYGPRSGALAAAVFAVYPAEIVYAFTGMAELTLTLAGVAAFATLVHLPRRWWPFAPPVLLALPFLFRETGAFLILPMAALVLRACGPLPALLTSAASVATLYAVNRWQIASGKLAASLAFVTEGRFNYDDAYPAAQPALSTGELLEAVAANVERNLGLLVELFGDWPGELMPIGLAIPLVLAPLVLAGGMLRCKQDPLPLACASLLALVLVATVTLYDTRAHKLMRTALFAFPFVGLAVAGLVLPDRLARPLPRTARRTAIGVAVLALGISFAVCARAGERMTRRDDEMAELSARLAELHDERLLIMGPPFLAPTYAVEHYPVLWSFYAADLPTYSAVQRRHPIGTILAAEPMPPVFLRTLGLRHATNVEMGGTSFLVYQRPPREDD